ncbi:hypothetical protein [Actinoplanes sp. CA-252034]|uniref:hypothetical protein n=1 Tax=Actinoplanes sp. CA-252034 TaxID=3239906 RepID=UPI003D99A7D7
MHDDFYTTLSQVLGVLVLSLMWDSQYLLRLTRQDRAGVLFWTKPRVRVYSLIVATTLIAGIATSMGVLGGFLDDTAPLRSGLFGILGLGLATLLTRLSADIITATRAPAAPPQPPQD